LGAPLGSYVASLISDRAERKWTLTIAGVLIAVSGLLYGMTFQPALIVIFGLSVNRSSADCDLQRKTACRPNF
jgi:putative MFS transporter